MYSLRLLTPTVLGTTVAVESHGLPFHRLAIEESGAVTLPVPLDDDGAVVDAIGDGVSSLVLTPSHQSPTGVSFRRQARGGDRLGPADRRAHRRRRLRR